MLLSDESFYEENLKIDTDYLLFNNCSRKLITENTEKKF